MAIAATTFCIYDHIWQKFENQHQWINVSEVNFRRFSDDSVNPRSLCLLEVAIQRGFLSLDRLILLWFHAQNWTGLEPKTTQFINKHSTIQPNWPNDSSCSHLNFRFCACFEQEFLDIQAKECEFTLKGVLDMIRTYSHQFCCLSLSLTLSTKKSENI